ncbi:CobD/CbiB family protein [Azovibrio restrictus]|uniref:CobD/CbiB family protein n=1 Tax=Azovibrio restrictus TaxID=146938 RepID=UPI0026F1E7FF|nr:CobD/CbiB family protein [Azovibrio restrictus]MDD3481422.1 CobD/CbiB family protein [Azovibrio restrictus]
MSLFSLIVVFLLEQLRPLDYARWVLRPFHAWADFLERRFNAGSYRQGILGWCLAVLPLLALVAGAYALLYWVSPLLALVLNVLVLYATMGFRQFSHFYTDIQLALRLGELERARAILAEWRGEAVAPHGPSDIARLAIETALAASHRHVFAVLLWFILLPGPLGALLYRFSHILAEYWRRHGAGGEFGKFSQQLFAIVDWLPVRASAAAFAVVGNFEDAVYCWRNQSSRWDDPELGIVLASGAGALGVRLGVPDIEAEALAESGELGVGEAADADFMQSAVGLVWRAIVLWLLMLFLLGLASLVGR